MHPNVPPEPRPRHQRIVEHAFFFALLVLTSVAFFGLIRGFLQPLFWAAVLAVIFQPLFRGCLNATRQRASLSSVLTIVSVVIIVFLPLFLVGLAVTREATSLYTRIASGEIDLQEPVRYVERSLPMVREFVDQVGIDLERVREGLSSTAVNSSRYVATRAIELGQNTLEFTALFFLMLYVLFFFLRDGEKIVNALIRAMPLGDERERRLFGKFAEVSRATIKGTLVVAVVQGGIGGLLFWLLGLSAPVFWGVIMAVLSLLPAIGSALVWGPAAIVLLVTGAVGKGIALLLAGTFVIGLVDNVLRPILVGRDTRMPDFLILLSTLGGIMVFGISGFVIGPIIASLFLAVWKMFEEEYAEAETQPEIIRAPGPETGITHS